MISRLIVGLILLSIGSARADGPWIGLALGRGRHGGVGVRSVVAGSPGAHAKISAGDEVLAVNGRRVSEPDDVIAAVRSRAVGQPIRLTLVSLTGTRTAELVLGARPSPEGLQRSTLLRREAPDFEPRVLAGEKFARLSALRGHVVLLDFFATWCGPCVQAMPHLQKMHERLGPKGLRIVGISTESPEVVAAAAERFRLRYSLVSDEDQEISWHFRIFALPTLVVIDRKGVVHEVSVADHEAADRAIAALMP